MVVEIVKSGGLWEKGDVKVCESVCVARTQKYCMVVVPMMLYIETVNKKTILYVTVRVFFYICIFVCVL